MKEAIITSSILIMCIVLLRQLCKRRISAKMQYMLWLVVAVRLIMPGITAVWPNLMPESGYSILNVTDKVERAALDIRVFEDAITFRIALMVVKYMNYMENMEY